MNDPIKLIAPTGTDEANHGGNRYRVANDQSVWADPEAVAPLLATGGFVLADPPVPPAPEGFIEVVHRSEPAAVLSADGTTYCPDENGRLTIPLTLFAAAACHGFVPAPRRQPPDGQD